VATSLDEEQNSIPTGRPYVPSVGYFGRQIFHHDILLYITNFPTDQAHGYRFRVLRSKCILGLALVKYSLFAIIGYYGILVAYYIAFATHRCISRRIAKYLGIGIYLGA